MTFSIVAGLTPGSALMTRDTVLRLTPASLRDVDHRRTGGCRSLVAGCHWHGLRRTRTLRLGEMTTLSLDTDNVVILGCRTGGWVDERGERRAPEGGQCIVIRCSSAGQPDPALLRGRAPDRRAARGRCRRRRAGPEEWVGSTTTSFGETTEGLSRLADGRVLRDAIVAEPVAYLGAEHLERWGPNPALLVKLLDAGERLAVHFHPGRAFAREMLGLDFGKTEAWIIVSADPGRPCISGSRSGGAPRRSPAGSPTRTRRRCSRPCASARSQPGTSLFVPAGTVHTIGAGILLVELQEPTDLSVLLEWRRFGVEHGR